MASSIPFLSHNFPSSFLVLAGPGLRPGSPDTLGHAKSASPKMAAEPPGASCGALVLWCRVDGHTKGWAELWNYGELWWRSNDPGEARCSESLGVIVSHCVCNDALQGQSWEAWCNCRMMQDVFLFIPAWPWSIFIGAHPIGLSSMSRVNCIFWAGYFWASSVAFWDTDQGFLLEPTETDWAFCMAWSRVVSCSREAASMFFQSIGFKPRLYRLNLTSKQSHECMQMAHVVCWSLPLYSRPPRQPSCTPYTCSYSYYSVRLLSWWNITLH